MFKTTQQKIDKLKIKIAGLEERISVREEMRHSWTKDGAYSYMYDKQKLAELKECLRQLEIQLIQKQQSQHKSV